MFSRGMLAALAVVSAALAWAQPNDSGLLTGISPAVVSLATYDLQGMPISRGTGFVVDREGRLVTNQSLVEGAGVVEITTQDGRVHTSLGVLAEDKVWDLAVISMSPGGIAPLALAEHAPPVDAPVHVVGSTVRLDSALFSGVVVGKKVHEGGVALLEISNQLYIETSGAPVLTNDGKVVGVVVYGGRFGEELNFAVPVEVLRPLIAAADPAQPRRRLGELTEQARQRVAQARRFRERMLEQCATQDVVNADRIVREAISLGAPVYNAGNHLLCFRIYEGASYKLLYLLGERCPTASGILGEAVVRANQEQTVTGKAWAMRFGFDTILGVPTRNLQPAQRAPDL